ncbi:TIGR03663 family protein [bacterium]|nr:MAG: TIGR03663 family protein [bacterium]
MKWRYLLFAIAVLAGVLLRLPQLGLRPMHVDEAVHAIKFGDLLERHAYRYDPVEYHGPTLNYFSLVPAYLASETTLARVHESTLRMVPVFFGVLLILLPLLIDDTVSPFVLVAALLTAVSPAMVFYSRYYIQEMLLVCFTFGAIVSVIRYLHGQKIGWAVLTGVCLGLMHATKETSIIAVGAMGAAATGVMMLRPRTERNLARIPSAHILIALLSAIVTSVLFFSSFLGNWQGVTDSLATYATYFGRAGDKTLHQHPWYYYLSMLYFSHEAGGPVWTESVILDLGIVGLFFTLPRWDSRKGSERDLGRFFAFYAILMTVIYSIIPYKTPWSMLGFLHAWIIVAAIGFSRLWSLASGRLARTVLVVLLVISGSHLAWQASLANFRYYDDPVNPYVYAQAVDDIVTVADAVRNIAHSAPEGEEMPVQVICEGDDYWPLPWYLRSLTNVGYWNHMGTELIPTPVILASPEVEDALLKKLYESPPPGERYLYVPLFATRMDIRPGKEIRGYVRHDVWEKYQQERLAQAPLVKRPFGP